MNSGRSPTRHTMRHRLGRFAPLITLGFVALCAWWAGSSAAPPAPAPKDAAASVWAQLDTNGDGRISVAESAASAEFKASFEMMDVDRDGFVSDREYRAKTPAALKREQQRQQRRDDMGEEEEERGRR